MSRTVAVKTIRKIRKSEISKFMEFTGREIIRQYDKVLSLFETEYLSKEYSEMRKLLTKITTADGHTLYIAHTELLVICSDELLASAIEAELGNYVACTHRDITALAGKTFSATQINYREENNEEKIREMRFSLPQKERGVHIFFFDDMD
ncbi:MAG: hypothetical protein IJN50_02925 [Clostridia bacterium]|nr:hypothetical protein [Clostridia bacterium]